MEGEAHTWLATAFAYDYVSTPVGVVPRPLVTANIAGPSGNANVEFLLDSGSDVTLIPLSIGRLLGFNPRAVVTTYGVSGSTQGELFDAQLTLAGRTFTAPVLVTLTDDSPPLIGRASTWSQFSSITLDNNAGAVCFGEPTTPLNQFLVNPNVWVVAGGIVAGFVLWAALK